MIEAAWIERIEIPVPFPPGSTNCYFIPDSIPTLIDSGINIPEALQGLQDGLKKFGVAISDIRRIVLTHGHADHAGAAGVIAAASRAPVFVHCRDKYWALIGREELRKKNEGFFHGFFEKAGVPEEIAREWTGAILSRFRKHFAPVSSMELLEGGEVFSFDRFKLKVFHTPGHTAGSICLLDETAGVIFSGDSLIKGTIPHVSAELESGEGLPRYYGLEQYEKSLELLGALPVRSVLPGHGAPFRDHRDLVARVKRNRVRRRKRILDLLRAKESKTLGASGMTEFEVAHRLFLSATIRRAMFSIISEVRSCLETMEKEGLVASVVSHGIHLYHPSCDYHEKEVSR
jgi:glyoxylase-like metal-dependent hydrolase (beta-lactamase superfamily II)